MHNLSSMPRIIHVQGRNKNYQMKNNNTPYKSNYKNIYSSKQNEKKNNDNDSYSQWLNCCLSKSKKILTYDTTIYYFSATILSAQSNGEKISNYKPKGEQKKIFLSSSDTLNSLSWSRDAEISRTTSGLTSKTKCKFTTLLCAPPQTFVVAGRTRSDLAISPFHSGVTTSNTQNNSLTVPHA